MTKNIVGVCLLSFLTLTAAHVCADEAGAPVWRNAFEATSLVANKAEYSPAFMVDKAMVNAWGIAIRPKGAGGHFWVTAGDTSYEYVGDVTASPDERLRKLHQDKLTAVKLPVGGKDKFATGTVFSDSKEHFVITQSVSGAEPITAPAKFLFASDGGIISAWTERKKPDGTFDRAGEALAVIDQSAGGAQFFGITVSYNYDRLYVADFGKQPAIKVFDGNFKPASVTFDMPFDENKNGVVDAGEYAPFNVQALATPAGEHHIFVTYAKTQPCNAEGLSKGDCAKGQLYAGEEDTAKPGQGRLAEFTEDGKLVRIWSDGGKLSAPWGIAFAPKNFGAWSGQLLVGNFGDGSIVAFNPATHAFLDVMRDANGKPVKVEKLWGLLFGNGESLGDADSLYFAAGPGDEKDGVFGRLRHVAVRSKEAK